MKKRIMILGLALVIVLMLAYLATSSMLKVPNNLGRTGKNGGWTNITYGNGTAGVGPGKLLNNGTNISRIRFFNVTFSSKNASQRNAHILNFTFYFNRSGVVTKFVITNRTANQTVKNCTGACVYFFNATKFNFWNFSRLVEGKYNLTIIVRNASARAGIPARGLLRSSIYNITIDNTKPSIKFLGVGKNTTSGGIQKYNRASGNKTFNVTVYETLSNISFVYIEFDNRSRGSATARPFNWSLGTPSLKRANGQAHHYNFSRYYNVSKLRGGGIQTAKVFVGDYADNVNTTTITFEVNTPPNVTKMSALRKNSNEINNGVFNVTSGNRTFNISVINATSRYKMDDVILMFDNASGKAFNRTAWNGSTKQRGMFWNFSVNMSLLRGGRHTVRVFANDTYSNLNQSITYSFLVNTPPNVTVMKSPGGSRATGVWLKSYKNFSHSEANWTFNISVINMTKRFSKRPIDDVILMFDNASGTNFNITMVRTLTKTSVDKHAGFTMWNTSFNVSKLTEGGHTVRVYANDTNDNYNTSVNISFRVDKTKPTVSVTCSPTTATVGQTVTCTCTATDAGAGLMSDNPRFIGDTDASESGVADSAGTKTSSVCTAVDFSGNQKTATGSYTVTESSTGGGGSGGSGGGSSSGVPGQVAQETWSSINAGETATVEVSNGALGVTEVSFSVGETVYGVWFKVAKTEGLPTAVQDSFEGGKIYKKLEVTKSVGLKDELISDAQIKFKVEKGWMSDNSLDKSQIALFHYADKQWSELTTTMGEDDGVYVHYTAKVPGFSYFIIGEKGITPTVVPETVPAGEEVTEEVTAGEETPEEVAATSGIAGKAGFTWGWVAAVIVALVVIAAIVIYVKKR